MKIPTEFELRIPIGIYNRLENWFIKNHFSLLFAILTLISVASYVHFFQNGLGLAYNDARSHLDISRRVVEGLKPGLAQLGSVWLPLPHILAALTVWNDFMWHSGLAGALVSMISFVATGLLIYKFLENIKVSIIGRLFGVFIFVANINILYLQSTAMTELLLIFTMMMGCYEYLMWVKSGNVLFLIKSAFWIMLSTLVRYDGWFLLFWVSCLMLIKLFMLNNTKSLLKKFQVNYTKVEGILILFLTLASFGIVLWLLWNLVIFKDPLYFALGPFSAKAQQDQLEAAGVLQTKHNLWLSLVFYTYALFFNSNAFIALLGMVGAIVLATDKKFSRDIKLAVSTLLAPFFFNILALYLGHSVLFIQGLSGDTWFNVRYGIMLMPSISIFIGYMMGKLRHISWLLATLLMFVLFFSFNSQDAVTIDDARVGSSQKNVSEVSGWLHNHAANEKGFVLISAASHDAIIFSSGMPMKRFIHEGTGLYWTNALALPDRWARWIIMRTYDDNDLTWKGVKESEGFKKYKLVDHFPFADIYQLDDQYLGELNTEASLGRQK